MWDFFYYFFLLHAFFYQQTKADIYFTDSSVFPLPLPLQQNFFCPRKLRGSEHIWCPINLKRLPGLAYCSSFKVIEFGLFQTLESLASPYRGISSDKIKYNPGVRYLRVHASSSPRTQSCSRQIRGNGNKNPNIFPPFCWVFLWSQPPFWSCNPAKWRHLVFAAASSLKSKWKGARRAGVPGVLCPVHRAWPCSWRIHLIPAARACQQHAAFLHSPPAEAAAPGHRRAVTWELCAGGDFSLSGVKFKR